jgi:hypothetical protein
MARRLRSPGGGMKGLSVCRGISENPDKTAGVMVLTIQGRLCIIVGFADDKSTKRPNNRLVSAGGESSGGKKSKQVVEVERKGATV